MRPGARINQLLNLGLEHALYFKDGNWYHQLKRFPGALLDAGGYLRFETEAAYQAYDGVRISPNHNILHVPAGIANIIGYRPFSEAELALIAQQDAGLIGLEPAPTTEQTLRKKRQLEVIVRNQQLVVDIKKLYKNTCQICGTRIQVRPGKYYSEVHHIKPLGQPHGGPDVKGNMLCVCPNHHTMLDFFAIRLDAGALSASKHTIGAEYIAYHNQLVEQFNPVHNTALTPTS